MSRDRFWAFDSALMTAQRYAVMATQMQCDRFSRVRRRADRVRRLLDAAALHRALTIAALGPRAQAGVVVQTTLRPGRARAAGRR